MKIPVNLPQNSYTVTVERGALKKADQIFRLNRKVLIVTDSGVPAQYAQTVAALCKEAVVVTVPQGESSKSLATFEHLLGVMLENRFTRTDCVVAVGGGVVGDLAGFVAASFMRGVDFYNAPTTVLSQVDSAVGGKVAVNLNGIKNCVGAFYQPKAVLIDPVVLETLPQRQIANGLAEAVKMAITFDADLFARFETENILQNIDDIIAASVKAKAAVVEQDEKEAGLRRVLNFGHTIGHGIEAAAGLERLYHGECVAIGMLPMCEENLRPRVKAVLEKLGLPTAFDVDADIVWEALTHDKKLSGDTIAVIYAPDAGRFEIKEMPLIHFKDAVISALKGM